MKSYKEGDTISRQAAIDALGEKPLAWTEGEYELGLQNQWQSDVDALKALPSAQPEPKWIPCSERLPLEYTRVIGYMAWKAMTAIEYQHGRWYSIDHLEPLPDEAVSHWMPLPQPPKEGDE